MRGYTVYFYDSWPCFAGQLASLILDCAQHSSSKLGSVFACTRIIDMILGCAQHSSSKLGSVFACTRIIDMILGCAQHSSSKLGSVFACTRIVRARRPQPQCGWASVRVREVVRVKTDCSPPTSLLVDGHGTNQGRCTCKNGLFTSYGFVARYIKKTQAVENDCLRFGW